jgi:hypothetical protein
VFGEKNNTWIDVIGKLPDVTRIGKRYRIIAIGAKPTVAMVYQALFRQVSNECLCNIALGLQGNIIRINIWN